MVMLNEIKEFKKKIYKILRRRQGVPRLNLLVLLSLLQSHVRDHESFTILKWFLRLTGASNN